MSNFRERVYGLVRRIPHGRVSTYADLAHAAGSPRAARQVGWALSVTPPGEEIPWWRVVKSSGHLPPHDCRERQADLLRGEGVVVSPEGRLDLHACGWDDFD